jgi:hypothetical protein
MSYRIETCCRRGPFGWMALPVVLIVISVQSAIGQQITGEPGSPSTAPVTR